MSFDVDDDDDNDDMKICFCYSHLITLLVSLAIFNSRIIYELPVKFWKGYVD